MDKLKLCPFCGGYVYRDKSYSYFREYTLYCNGCDMIFTLDAIFANEEDLIETFNRRADNGLD